MYAINSYDFALTWVFDYDEAFALFRILKAALLLGVSVVISFID